MKLWESMLAVLLCVGLVVAIGLTACGDDDDEGDPRCDSTCNKIVSCAADFIPPLDFGRQECIEGCNADIDAQAECAFDCDRGLACPAYADCIQTTCGITFD